MTDTSQQFLDDHQQLQPGESFRFACHPGVPCFNACCSNLNLMLTPYDTLRLRKSTGQSSREFVRLFAELSAMPGVGLPMLKMKMLDSAGRKCPFQRPEGCAVYPHRPSACRTYPLGRATQPGEDGADGAGDEPGQSNKIIERLFVIREPHCRGFEAGTEMDFSAWVADQGLAEYNAANDRYMGLAAGLREMIGRGMPPLSQKQTGMAGLALYQPDEFRMFLGQSGLLERLDISDERKAGVLSGDEEACLDFGFDWLELSMLGRTERLSPKS